MKKETIILVLFLAAVAVGIIWVLKRIKATDAAIAASKA